MRKSIEAKVEQTAKSGRNPQLARRARKVQAQLRDTLPLFGAQRLTSLGYACHVTSAMPQDAIEPLRRMCKWIVDEECDPEVVFPMWKVPAL